MKKGQRAIPPKNSVAIKQRQATKVSAAEGGTRVEIGTHTQRQNLSAKITRSIEQQTAAAASSGKLTIMKPAALNSNG